MPEFIPGLVSIVTPAYNAEAFLAETVASVQAQTYRHWEMMVVDDRSQDGTLALARRLASEDSRISVIARRQNGGAAAAKNDAIRAARGQYVAYLDSDDIWLPHKLKTQVEFMQQRSAGLCFSSYQPFTASGKLLRPVLAPRTITYRDLLKYNVMGCLTVVIDRSLHPTVPTPTLDYEDFVSWLTLLRDGGDAYGITDVLALYRVSSQSVSSKKTRSARWVWRIYREHENLPLLQSLWCFSSFAATLIKRRFLRVG